MGVMLLSLGSFRQSILCSSFTRAATFQARVTRKQRNVSMNTSLNKSHKKLLKQSSHHNQQAFKQLYDATSPLLYGLSLRMLGKKLSS